MPRVAARMVRASTMGASRSPAAELAGGAIRALDRLEDSGPGTHDLVVLAAPAGELTVDDLTAAAAFLEQRLEGARAPAR